MPAPALPAAKSITHLHLLAVVNSRIQTLKTGTKSVRLCDIGCGDGEMLSYLASCLPRLNPELEFEFFGIDVADSGVQAEGFFARTLATLSAAHPQIEWQKRLHLVTSHSRWPFEDGALNIIVSNQVLEHVVDHRHFFEESHRTLATGGIGAHLFPLKHYVWEGHVHMPFLHRIRQHHVKRAYIKLMTRLGTGSFQAHQREYGMTLDYYAEEHADYMTFMTKYLTAKQLLDLCKAARLRSDFSYTRNFYGAKLRAMRRGAPRYLYPAPRPFWDTFLFFFLKRVSSITLFVEKRQIYAR